MNNNVLKVTDLEVGFKTYAGNVQAVRGVNFELKKGEILAIVGESGCGKSVTAQTIMRLNPTPPAYIGNGSITFEDKDILSLSEREMRAIRGKKIGMIFQDPMTSLDPTKTIGYQIMESLKLHEKISKKDAYDRAIEMLKKVGINDPEQRMSQYPFEFSGGMRQRAMIAGALVCNPELLIADEPTTALDVTIQAQIIDLMLELRADMGTSTIIITHDMGVVADIADRVIIMYAGKIVETGTVEEIFYSPKHPYTWGLLGSIPTAKSRGEDLTAIEGTPPDLITIKEGCAFAARCEYCMGICAENTPKPYDLSDTHSASCFLLDERAPAVKCPLEEVQ